MGDSGFVRASGFVTSFAPMMSDTSVRENSGLASSISLSWSYGTSASASRTFMCPGMRPATGWMAYLTEAPRPSRICVSSRTDVSLIIGANDVTNPDARNKADSPIYGMPILNVDDSRSVIVLKRSMNSGFAGIDNPLFYNEKTAMLFGDAKSSVSEITGELSGL